MDYEEEEVSDFPASEVDWGEESNHSWGGEEDHEGEPWGDQTDSEISFEDERESEEDDDYGDESWTEDEDSHGEYGEDSGREELDPKPPDYDRDDTSHHSSYEEEAYHEGMVEEDHEGDSWCEETDSQISLEDEIKHEAMEPDHTTTNNYYDYSSKYDENFEVEDHKGELWHEEADSIISFEEESELEMMESNPPDQVQASSTIHSNEDEDDYEPQPITFSGYKKNPEVYMRWEEDMEAWFQVCHIPEEEKLSYVIDTLTEEAYKWWEKEEAAQIYYGEPVHTWESLRVEMYAEYVEKNQPHDNLYTKGVSLAPQRGWIQATIPKSKIRRSQTYSPKPKTTVPSTWVKRTKNATDCS